MEEGENLTPFWQQSTTNLRRLDRYRYRLSSLFFNVGVLLMLLLVTAVFSMVFVIPTTQSFSAQIFRPNTVRKSWDSINVALVLFALLFGFLSRNRNYDDSSFDHRQTSSNSTNVGQKSNPSTPNKWYDYSDWTVFNNPTRSMGGLIRRNSTSYPDLHLREVSSPWVTGDDQWRFYDDTHVNSYRFVDSDRRVYYRRRSWKEADKQDIETKNIHVDTFVSKVPEEESPYVSPPRYSPPPPSAQPPPQPPQRRSAKGKEKIIYHTIRHEGKTSQIMRYDLEPAESLTPPLAAPPPPMQYWEQKSGRSDRKKRDGGNASKDNFLTSFYHKKKKKRQRQRSVENLDAFFHHSQPPPTHSPTPPPSPSVFHNLFSSRKSKRMRIPSDPHPAHPAPPPPTFTVVRELKSRNQTQPATTYKPPLPVRISSFKSVDENSSSGGSSPLVPIPPPPPPMPFKMPEWKFVVQGDYVSIHSNPSSRSGSPDQDDVETSTPGGDATSSALFCPSPDVDTKADNFIARFRAELKLQKINSFNQKQGIRMSNLGPGVGPTQI